MTYEIKFSKQATKFINGLQQNLKDRIIAKFREISENPFIFLEHYEGDYYKIRIGDFRALVDIDNERRILWIRVFDKRGRIYER